MLRFLITALLIIFPLLSISEEIVFEEPNAKELKRQADNARAILGKVDLLKNSKDYNDERKIEVDSALSVPLNTKSRLYDLGLIKPEIKDDRYLSKAIAAGNEKINHISEEWTNAPLIMISFSMPEATIRSLVKESSKVGANIVLRGAYENDLTGTIERIQKIAVEEGASGIQIDPTLFKRFSITTVPAFVLPLEPIKTCDDKGCPVPNHIKAHGTASLRYFLEKVSRLGDEKESLASEIWLNKYDLYRHKNDS